MKILHIVCMVLIIAMMQHTCLAEATLDNTKEWDAENQTITIFDDSKTKLMTVKLISARPDICTFTEIYEVSNFEAYTPGSKTDFTARTDTKVGSGVIIKIEWFSEQNVSYVVNVSDYDIEQAEEIIYNNKTGKNETVLVNRTVITGYHDETRYRDVWIDYQPYDKEMKIGSVQRIKVVYHKTPELGPFRIQTVPMFRGVECPELTWWSGSWDLLRAILINNTGGDSVTDYQLRSVNLSSFNINAISSRIVNETSGLQESFWNETVDASGNLEYVWCNFSNLSSGGWINSTYYIYYQSSPSVGSASDGDATFPLFDDFFGSSVDATKWTSTGASVSDGIVTIASSSGNNIQSIFTFGQNYAFRSNATSSIWHTSGAIDSYPHIGFRADTENGAVMFFGDYPNEGDSFLTQSDAGVNSQVIITSKAPNQYYIFDGIRNGNTNTQGWVDGVLEATNPSNLPTIGLEFTLRTDGSVGYIPIIKADWVLVRNYTANEPEPWTVGDEEEYPTPTPTPTPVPTTSVSSASYDKLDLSLILYILTISLLYLLIAFRNGVATIELSLIYLIFAFFFLLFQTITISVNYIYLTLFLLLFLISIAGITKQGAD